MCTFCPLSLVTFSTNTATGKQQRCQECSITLSTWWGIRKTPTEKQNKTVFFPQKYLNTSFLKWNALNVQYICTQLQSFMHKGWIEIWPLLCHISLWILFLCKILTPFLPSSRHTRTHLQVWFPNRTLWYRGGQEWWGLQLCTNNNNNNMKKNLHRYTISGNNLHHSVEL